MKSHPFEQAISTTLQQNTATQHGAKKRPGIGGWTWLRPQRIGRTDYLGRGHHLVRFDGLWLKESGGYVWKLIILGVPWCTILGPTQFHIYKFVFGDWRAQLGPNIKQACVCCDGRPNLPCFFRQIHIWTSRCVRFGKLLVFSKQHEASMDPLFFCWNHFLTLPLLNFHLDHVGPTMMWFVLCCTGHLWSLAVHGCGNWCAWGWE